MTMRDPLMYHNILVAVDNSSLSDTIFQTALTLAQTMQGSVLIVHILSGEEESSPLPLSHRMESIYWAPGTDINLETWKEAWHRYEVESLDHLQHLTRQATAAGVQTTFRQFLGRPGQAICKAARQWGAEVIVIGHQGRQGLSEMVMGSVSNYVVHHAPCSVLVVKPKGLQGISLSTWDLSQDLDLVSFR